MITEVAPRTMLTQGSSLPSSPNPRRFKAPIASTHARRARNRRERPRKGKVKAKESSAADLTDTRLLHNPRSRAIAPFTARSEAEDTNLRFLINYYVTVVTVRSVTVVAPRFEWYPLAVRDEAFFHALISSTSSHAAYRQQVELPRAFYFHRGKAIRLLNERIAHGSHDEGTINTIAVFAQQESFEGRPASSKIHLHGLLQLVRAAGGLHSPALSAKTRRHVMLTDLSACIPLDSKPVLAPTLVSSLETYFGLPSPETALYAKTFGTRLYNFTGSRLSDQAANVLWGLRNISAILEDIHDGSEAPETPWAEGVQFTDRVEVLQRLVNDLWYVEDPNNEQHIILRTFGWACLIYIYCTLRELPPELGMNPMLASRIKAALEAYPDLNVLLATFQDLMLWQMFICGRVADPRDRPFFASNATKILLIQKVDKPIDIIVASEGFLWPERQVGLPVRTKVVLHRIEEEEGSSDDDEGSSEMEELTPSRTESPTLSFDADNP